MGPVPACGLSLSDAKAWSVVAISGTSLTMRLPPQAALAPPDYITPPTQILWWIPEPDSAYGFVHLWVGREGAPVADPVANPEDESHCTIQLGGRTIELTSGITFSSLGPHYHAGLYWPLTSDSGVYLKATSPSITGIRIGLTALRSIWPGQDRP